MILREAICISQNYVNDQNINKEKEMKFLIIVLTVFLSASVFANDDWFVFTKEKNDRPTNCMKANRRTHPYKMIAYLDMMGGTKYKVENEQSDETGRKVSINIIRNYKGSNPETYYYFRTKGECQAAFNLFAD